MDTSPGSGIVIRRATAADEAGIFSLDGASFGIDYGPEEMADARAELPVEDCLVAVERGPAGDSVVGVTGDYRLRVALPGGGDVEAGGVTWVSVEVTHRRRGILRALLDRQLREHAAGGAAVSALIAAEGGIYGRFGFGVASRFRTTELTRRPDALASAPHGRGTVRRLATAQVADSLPGAYERWRGTSPAAVSRTPGKWHRMLADRPSQRSGWSALHHLLYTADGRADGYVSYRLKQDWTNAASAVVCRIVDYAPATAEAHAALWRTLLAMDLVGTIVSDQIPLDDPLPWLLPDPRAVRTTMVQDGLWLRPLDVARLLAARDYGAEVTAVLEIADPLLGDGRYRLAAGPGGAECERTDDPADARFGVADLGAVVAGGTRVLELARAGRVSGDGAVLRRLDRAFVADRLPAHGTFF